MRLKASTALAAWMAWSGAALAAKQEAKDPLGVKPVPTCKGANILELKVASEAEAANLRKKIKDADCVKDAGKVYQVAELTQAAKAVALDAETKAKLLGAKTLKTLQDELQKKIADAQEKRKSDLTLKPAPAAPPPTKVSALPTLKSAYPVKGQPGDWIRLSGTDLGSAGTITFKVSDTKTVAATETRNWRTTSVEVRIPPVTGVLAYSGSVTATIGKATTKPLAFAFEPTTAIYILDESRPQDYVAWDFKCLFSSTSTWQATHGHDWYFQCKGTDAFYSGRRLKDPWVVKKVELHKFSTWPGNPDVDAKFKRPPALGGTVLFTEVEWTAKPANSITYLVQAYAEGPAGFTQKDFVLDLLAK